MIAILSFLQHQGSESFTPLLDWTYKFEHSLFFAIDRMKTFSKSESEIDNYFSIYYLEEEFFEDGDLTAIVQKVLDENSENIFNGLIESLDGPKEKVKSFVNSMTDNSKRLFAYHQSGQGAIRNITKIEKLINFPLAFFSEVKVHSPFKYSLVNNFNIINQKGAFTWNSSPNKPLEYVAKEEYLKENDKDYFFCNCLNINKALKFHVINKLDSLNINRNFIYPNPDDLANEAFKLTKKILQPLTWHLKTCWVLMFL